MILHSSSPLIGHELIVRMLDRAVVEERLRHAYLFVGPARVGKSTVARWLALRLACPSERPPCGTCPACRLIQQNQHPDVRAIQAGSDRDAANGLALDVPQRPARSAERQIGIDQIRALQHDAALAPHAARWKVYLITGAENLTLEAANCLLKTLEEPPRHVLLVLTAVDPGDLPPTVVSRCQVVRFAPVPPATIAEGVARVAGCEPERAELLARLSGGCPGWALEAATRPALLEERASTLDRLNRTLAAGFRDRLDLAEQLAAEYSRDQGRVLHALALWQSFWWDVRLIQIGCTDLLTNLDRRENAETFAARVPPPAVDAQLRRVGLAAQRLVQNVNPRLALEALLVQAPIAR